MVRTREVQPNEHDHLPRPVLQLDLPDVDLATADVEQELLSTVCRLEWNRDRFTSDGEVQRVVGRAVILDADEEVCFGLLTIRRLARPVRSNLARRARAPRES